MQEPQTFRNLSSIKTYLDLRKQFFLAKACVKVSTSNKGHYKEEFIGSLEGALHTDQEGMLGLEKDFFFSHDLVQPSLLDHKHFFDGLKSVHGLGSLLLGEVYLSESSLPQSPDKGVVTQCHLLDAL